jgi:hypothetical protein
MEEDNDDDDDDDDDIYTWQYLVQFFLEWEMFRQKLWRKSKQTFYVQNIFSENPAVMR